MEVDATRPKLLNLDIQKLSNMMEGLQHLQANLTNMTLKAANAVMSFKRRQISLVSLDWLVFLCAMCALSISIVLVWYVVNSIQSRSKLRLLHKAVQNNNTQLALSYLDASLVNKPLRKDGYTPFLRACLNGNTVLVKVMLEYGADIHATTPTRENAFYLAAFRCVGNLRNKDASCIHALYHAGVDINLPNAKGVNAVQMAATFGHAGLVRWLIEKDVNLNVTPRVEDIAKEHGYTLITSLMHSVTPWKRSVNK